MPNKKKKTDFEKFAGEFKNETELEEELEAEGKDPEKAESEYLEEKDEPAI